MTAKAQKTEHRIRIGEEKRLRTRRRLIAAACKVIAERGEEAASIDAFIKEAGVARATFYNHFSTREEITAALWEEIGHGSMLGIVDAYADVRDPARRISIAARYTMTRASHDSAWGWLFVHTALSAGEPNRDLRAFIAADLKPLSESGAFPIEDLETATDFMIGSGAMAVKAILSGKQGADTIPAHCRMLLLGLGVSKSRVSKIVTMDMPAIYQRFY